jgi:hypothetical protein
MIVHLSERRVPHPRCCCLPPPYVSSHAARSSFLPVTRPPRLSLLAPAHRAPPRGARSRAVVRAAHIWSPHSHPPHLSVSLLRLPAIERLLSIFPTQAPSRCLVKMPRCYGPPLLPLPMGTGHTCQGATGRLRPSQGHPRAQQVLAPLAPTPIAEINRPRPLSPLCYVCFICFRYFKGILQVF